VRPRSWGGTFLASSGQVSNLSACAQSCVINGLQGSSSRVSVGSLNESGRRVEAVAAVEAVQCLERAAGGDLENRAAAADTVSAGPPSSVVP